MPDPRAEELQQTLIAAAPLLTVRDTRAQLGEGFGRQRLRRLAPRLASPPARGGLQSSIRLPGSS